MGDIADGMINGDFDSMTGEYLGKGGGFPRTKITGRVKHFTPCKTWTQEVRKVFSFLHQRGVYTDGQRSDLVKEYGEIISTSLKKTSDICAKIRSSKDDWSEFKMWVSERLKK